MICDTTLCVDDPLLFRNASNRDFTQVTWPAFCCELYHKKLLERSGSELALSVARMYFYGHEKRF
jgi:hypothetical protein